MESAYLGGLRQGVGHELLKLAARAGVAARRHPTTRDRRPFIGVFHPNTRDIGCEALAAADICGRRTAVEAAPRV